MLDLVAPEIKAAPRWVVWRGVPQPNGKLSKVPLNAKTGFKCDIGLPSSWCDFAHAMGVCSNPAYGVDGSGFCMGGGFSGADLDGVIGPDGHVLDARNQAIVDALSSYTEYSPSGTGLHVIGGGEVPSGRRFNNLEVYGEGRFFTMTGQVYQGRNQFQGAQDTFNDLVATIDHYRGERAGAVAIDFGAEDIDDTVLLNKILSDPRTGAVAQQLANGEWHGLYPSQSEADQALVNMISKHTRSPSQVQRFFRASVLGQREKAERSTYVLGMVRKGYDKQEPEVEIPKLQIPAVAPKVELRAGEQKAEDVASCYAMPGGMLGQIANYIYQDAIKPMEEASIAAALALMAGICGRQFQCNGTGLNLYIMLLAQTGSGKESMSTGVSKLLHACTRPGAAGPSLSDLGMTSATDFIGPEDLTGKGLLNAFAKSGTMSYLSIFPEFAVKMAQMAAPNANAGDQQLKRWLLAFFMRSGAGSVFSGTMSADKDKDIKVLQSPSISILCESTPARLYQALTTDMIDDGLLPRFAVFERTKRTYYKTKEQVKNIPPPPELVASVRSLMYRVILAKTQGNDTRFDVPYTSDAEQRQQNFRDYCEDKLHNTQHEGSKQLWNRANLKTQRMAALYAIGMNPERPVIESYMVDWAAGITHHEISRLVVKFERGEVGQTGRVDDRGIRDETLRFCHQFLEYSPNTIQGPGYRRYAKAHSAGYVPYSFLLNRANTTPFRNDPRGQKRALEDTLRSLVDSGDLRREQPMQDGQQVDFGGIVYRLVHHS